LHRRELCQGFAVLPEMPHFYFHITDGFKVRDSRGLQLPNTKAACRYGEELAQGFNLVAQQSGAGGPSFVEVVDEAGVTVARLKVVPESKPGQRGGNA
jgi:Domain of unknown function (DUF6894)